MKKIFKNTVIEIMVGSPVLLGAKPAFKVSTQLETGLKEVPFTEFSIRIASIKADSWYTSTYKELGSLRANELKRLGGLGQLAFPQKGINTSGGDGVKDILSPNEIEIIEQVLLPAIENGRFTHIRHQKQNGDTIAAHDVSEIANYVSRSGYKRNYEGWQCPTLRFDYRGEEFLKAALKTVKEFSDILGIPRESFFLEPVRQFTWSTIGNGQELYDIGYVTARELGLKP